MLYQYKKINYRGRFAPSPTGGLHMGSLVSACASFLDAKASQGEWLIRMEDIDPPREQAGATEEILRALEAHHLSTCSEIIFQSKRSHRYISAIKQLWQQGDVYSCRCSSKQIKVLRKECLYCPCRDQSIIECMGEWHENILDELDQLGGALRLRVDELAESQIVFEDRHYGVISKNVAKEVGDFIIRRSDGLFAYQLAVVVDDAWQGITDVVRGADLLDVTPRQIFLQKKLGLPTPRYRHVPLVYDEQGNKLSKQHFAPVLDNALALDNLRVACRYLNIKLEDPQSIEDLLSQAVDAWVK